MIKIISFVDSFKHYNEPIKEFQKRLGKQIEIIKLKPVKNGNIIEKETEILRTILEKENGFKIILNPSGSNITTSDFCDLLESKKMNYKNIIFIIGGANGINYNKVRHLVDLELNLGKMIMPHILALLVLIEQIYRASMIKKGAAYHK